MRAALKNLAVLAAVLAACLLMAFTVGCPIKAVTGFPCPGCGMTRGCLSLLRLDFAGAFRWHPLCFLAPFGALAYIFKDSRGPLRIFTRTPALVAAAVLMLAVYAARMALMFPAEPPMDFYEKSLFGKIVLNFLLQ